MLLANRSMSVRVSSQGAHFSFAWLGGTVLVWPFRLRYGSFSRYGGAVAAGGGEVWWQGAHPARGNTLSVATLLEYLVG